MWSSRKALGAACAAAFCGAALAAQQAPPASSQVFRSGAQVVEVDARVFDADGRFVTNLTRDDFEILEDGVAQPIVAMSLVGGALAESAEPAEPGQPAQPAQPPDQVTSRQTWVFFFDVNHLTPGAGFERAREAAAAFARERFRDGDMAGVIDGKGMVNGRLTTIREEIVKAIEGVKPDPGARTRMVEMTREWPRLLSEDEATRIADHQRDAIEAAVCRATKDRTGEDRCDYGEDELPVLQKARTVMTMAQRATSEALATIDALGAGLARMTGPKTVVYISQGFPIAGMDTTVRSIVGQMARAGARVYSLDVRGINRAGNNVDQAYVTNEAGAAMSFDAQADAINSLAVDTGGIMIRNENNFGRALDRIAADAGRYYVLGYEPANTTLDGKYRAIEVRVKRPGLRVRARRGYLALPPAQMLVPQPIRSTVEDAPRAEVAAPQPDLAPIAASTPAIAEPPVDAPVSAPAVSAPAAGSAADPAPVRSRPAPEDRVRALSGGDAKVESAGGEARAGWDAYQRGDLEAALPLFEKAAAEPGVLPWTLYALGLTQAGLGQPDAAIASWERVRAMEPGYAPVYTDLAATYASRARLTDALTVLRAAAERWPDNADFHNGIGVILVRRDALDEAIDAFAKAAKAAPGDPLTHLNLGRAYDLRYTRNLRFIASQRRWVAPEGDRKKAAAAYQRCIELGGPYARQAAAALGRLEWTGDK